MAQGRLFGGAEGRMSDDDKLSLRPATAQEIEESLSFALRYAGRKRVHHC